MIQYFAGACATTLVALLFLFLFPTPEQSVWHTWRHRCRHIDGWMETRVNNLYLHRECVICGKREVIDLRPGRIKK